jgi:hypothetical protein
MTGATASAAGSSGLVPQPLMGDEDKILKGDGTWGTVDIGIKSKLVIVDIDTVTNTSGSYTHTTAVTGVTSDMKPIKLDLGTPSIFRASVHVTTGDGTVTLECSDVSGTSTVKVSLLITSNFGDMTSSEFDVLANRIENATLPMTGATSSTDGSSGMVPAPLMGDQNKYLRGTGTWEAVPTSGRIVKSKYYNSTTSGSCAVDATTTVTVTMDSNTGSSRVIIPYTCNYGLFGAISISGNTVTITLRNISNGAHTLACAIIVLDIS